MLLKIWPSTRFLTSSCQPLHFYYLGCHRFHHCTSYPDVRCSFDPDDKLSRGGWISGINQVNGSQLYTQLGLYTINYLRFTTILLQYILSLHRVSRCVSEIERMSEFWKLKRHSDIEFCICTVSWMFNFIQKMNKTQ